MKIFKIILTVAAFALFACEEPDYGSTPNTTIASLGTPENNEIWFTTTDGKTLLNLDEEAFDVAVADILYNEYGIHGIANSRTRLSDFTSSLPSDDGFSQHH